MLGDSQHEPLGSVGLKSSITWESSWKERIQFGYKSQLLFKVKVGVAINYTLKKLVHNINITKSREYHHFINCWYTSNTFIPPFSGCIYFDGFFIRLYVCNIFYRLCIKTI